MKTLARYPNPRKKRTHPLLFGGSLVLFMALVGVALYGLKMLQDPSGENIAVLKQNGNSVAAASEAAANDIKQMPDNELVTQIPPNPIASTLVAENKISSATDAANPAETLDPQEYPMGRLTDGLTFDRLYVEKAKHRLTAFSKGKAVRIYKIALGEAPVGAKRFQGDMKTPEGKYTIDGKNPRSAYYKNVGVSYPNKADREYAAKQGKDAGGDIKIHGLAPAFAHLGKLHRETDWTYGCIAVTNAEIEEIYMRTAVGTPIEIVP